MKSIRTGKVRAPRPFPLRAPAILAAASAAAGAFLEERGALNFRGIPLSCSLFSRMEIYAWTKFAALRVRRLPLASRGPPGWLHCPGARAASRAASSGRRVARSHVENLCEEILRAQGEARNHSRVLLCAPGRSNSLRLGAKARCTSLSREGGVRQGARAAARAWLQLFCKAWMVMLIAASRCVGTGKRRLLTHSPVLPCSAARVRVRGCHSVEVAGDTIGQPAPEVCRGGKGGSTAGKNFVFARVACSRRLGAHQG